jgi:gamma-glutamylaminecyclotransferase
MNQNYKVFVYGTLKHGERLHHLLEGPGCSYIGRGWTARTDFVLRRTNDKPFGFPILLQQTVGLSVAGEVYEIPDTVLSRLDFAESNGIMYEREELQIRLNRDQSMETAWTYLGVPQYWLGPNGKGLRRLPLCDIDPIPTKHFVFRNSGG